MKERDIELAKKAKLPVNHPDWADATRRFAALIRADEREAIAVWLEGEAGTGRVISCMGAAKAIRARGNT